VFNVKVCLNLQCVCPAYCVDSLFTGHAFNVQRSRVTGHLAPELPNSRRLLPPHTHHFAPLTVYIVGTPDTPQPSPGFPNPVMCARLCFVRDSSSSRSSLTNSMILPTLAAGVGEGIRNLIQDLSSMPLGTTVLPTDRPFPNLQSLATNPGLS